MLTTSLVASLLPDRSSQIEHHLLPGINHYHLYWMSPKIKEVCEKHDVTYTKMKNFAEALEMLEESKATGEVPTHAVYEMLIRGCTIAMRRVGPGETADHLTQNLLGKVTELWTDMEAQGRKPDYLTYNELIRAYGKAGRVREAGQGC